MTTGNYDPNVPGYRRPADYPPPPAWGQQSGAYPPPASWGQQQGAQRGRQPGGLGRRFSARLIDGILANIVAFVLSLFMLGNDYWFLTTGLFSGVLTFGYFVLFEVTGGSSPGKRLLGLAVRGPGGAPKPTASKSAIRNAFTLLAVVPYLGGLLAFVAYIVIAVTINGSPTKQGKHDELAGGTQVLKD